MSVFSKQTKSAKLENVVNIEDKKIFQEETDRFADNIIKTSIKFDELDEPDKIKELLHTSKFLFIIGRFEWIYNAIFGSQIKLLEYLNSLNASTKADLKKYFYDYVSVKHPEVFSNYDYDSYLNFLLRYDLIHEVNPLTIQITQMGQDFLVFLVQVKKDKNKLY